MSRVICSVVLALVVAGTVAYVINEALEFVSLTLQAAVESAGQ